MTTSQLIDALVAHYGSTQAVNAACAALGTARVSDAALRILILIIERSYRNEIVL